VIVLYGTLNMTALS